jgi:hypothetical protein
MANVVLPLPTTFSRFFPEPRPVLQIDQIKTLHKALSAWRPSRHTRISLRSTDNYFFMEI